MQQHIEEGLVGEGDYENSKRTRGEEEAGRGRVGEEAVWSGFEGLKRSSSSKCERRDCFFSMSPRQAGWCLAALTGVGCGYCIAWLVLPAFYEFSPAVHLLFPSPLLLLYAAAAAVVLLMTVALASSGVLMIAAARETATRARRSSGSCPAASAAAAIERKTEQRDDRPPPERRVQGEGKRKTSTRQNNHAAAAAALLFAEKRSCC